MHYLFFKDTGHIVNKAPFVTTGEEVKEDVLFTSIDCWSLTALLELMPPYLFERKRGIDLNIYRNINDKIKGWHVSYMPNNIIDMQKDKFRQITNGDNPIDAAFQMVCWLIEQGHIKVNK